MEEPERQNCPVKEAVREDSNCTPVESHGSGYQHLEEHFTTGDKGDLRKKTGTSEESITPGVRKVTFDLRSKLSQESESSSVRLKECTKQSATSTFAFSLKQNSRPAELPTSEIRPNGLQKPLVASQSTRLAMGSGASKEENELAPGDGGDHSRQVQSQAAMSDAPGSRSQASFSGRPMRSHMSQQGRMSAIAESSRSRASRVGR